MVRRSLTPVGHVLPCTSCGTAFPHTSGPCITLYFMWYGVPSHQRAVYYLALHVVRRSLTPAGRVLPYTSCGTAFPHTSRPCITLHFMWYGVPSHQWAVYYLSLHVVWRSLTPVGRVLPCTSCGTAFPHTSRPCITLHFMWYGVPSHQWAVYYLTLHVVWRSLTPVGRVLPYTACGTAFPHTSGPCITLHFMWYGVPSHQWAVYYLALHVVWRSLTPVGCVLPCTSCGTAFPHTSGPCITLHFMWYSVPSHQWAVYYLTLHVVRRSLTPVGRVLPYTSCGTAFSHTSGPCITLHFMWYGVPSHQWAVYYLTLHVVRRSLTPVGRVLPYTSCGTAFPHTSGLCITLHFMWYGVPSHQWAVYYLTLHVVRRSLTPVHRVTRCILHSHPVQVDPGFVSSHHKRRRTWWHCNK